MSKPLQIHKNVKANIMKINLMKIVQIIRNREGSFALTQLAHDVVTMLGFGFILVATSDKVVTMLSFRHRYYD